MKIQLDQSETSMFLYKEVDILISNLQRHKFHKYHEKLLKSTSEENAENNLAGLMFYFTTNNLSDDPTEPWRYDSYFVKDPQLHLPQAVEVKGSYQHFRHDSYYIDVEMIFDIVTRDFSFKPTQVGEDQVGHGDEVAEQLKEIMIAMAKFLITRGILQTRRGQAWITAALSM